jgi:hypothetical protein
MNSTVVKFQNGESWSRQGRGITSDHRRFEWISGYKVTQLDVRRVTRDDHEYGDHVQIEIAIYDTKVYDGGRMRTYQSHSSFILPAAFVDSFIAALQVPA